MVCSLPPSRDSSTGPTYRSDSDSGSAPAKAAELQESLPTIHLNNALSSHPENQGREVFKAYQDPLSARILYAANSHAVQLVLVKE